MQKRCSVRKKKSTFICKLCGKKAPREGVRWLIIQGKRQGAACSRCQLKGEVAKFNRLVRIGKI